MIPLHLPQCLLYYLPCLLPAHSRYPIYLLFPPTLLHSLPFWSTFGAVTYLPAVPATDSPHSGVCLALRYTLFLLAVPFSLPLFSTVQVPGRRVLLPIYTCGREELPLCHAFYAYVTTRKGGVPLAILYLHSGVRSAMRVPYTFIRSARFLHIPCLHLPYILSTTPSPPLVHFLGRKCMGGNFTVLPSLPHLPT